MIQINKSILSVIILISISIMLLSGCSQTADNLYKDGQNLISKPETMQQGLEKLVLFEKRFGGDLRAPEVVLTIAEIQLQQKDYDGAVETFGRLLTKYPLSHEAEKGMFLLGYAYYDQIGNKEKAVESFENFLIKYPDSELAASAKTILDNIDIPIDQWPVMKQIEQTVNKSDRESGIELK